MCQPFASKETALVAPTGPPGSFPWWYPRVENGRVGGYLFLRTLSHWYCRPTDLLRTSPTTEMQPLNRRPSLRGACRLGIFNNWVSFAFGWTNSSGGTDGREPGVCWPKKGNARSTRPNVLGRLVRNQIETNTNPQRCTLKGLTETRERAVPPVNEEHVCCIVAPPKNK